MRAGVRCGQVPPLTDINSSNFGAFACIDATTNVYTFTPDTLRWQGMQLNQANEIGTHEMWNTMPLYAVHAMADMLYVFNNPGITDITATTDNAIQTLLYAQADDYLCLDVVNGGTDSGTPVQIWGCNGTPAQQWHYNRREGTIVNLGSGKCLDVSGANPASGTQVQIWDCNGTPAQQWSYDPVNYHIRNGVGTVLDVQNGTPASGTPVWAYYENQTPAQMWFSNSPSDRAPIN